MYRANLEKVCVGLVAASSFVVISIIFVIALGLNFVVGLVLAVSIIIWLLVVLIVLGHSASSLDISEGTVTQLCFGRRVQSIPLSELVELKIVSAVYPGILRFKDGTEIHVSGIAVGQEDGLARFIEEHAPEVRINKANDG